MLKLSQVLERFSMEYTEMKNSLDARLQIDPLCFIRIRYRTRDTFKNKAVRKVKMIDLKIVNPENET